MEVPARPAVHSSGLGIKLRLSVAELPENDVGHSLLSSLPYRTRLLREFHKAPQPDQCKLLVLVESQ